MKVKSYLIVVFIFCSNMSNAQIGIGTKTPSTSSLLDIRGTDKGILIPRVSLTDVLDNTTITGGNVVSLLVYNVTTVNDVVEGYYYWNGTMWTQLGQTITSISQDTIAKTITYIDELGVSTILSVKTTTGGGGGSTIVEPWFGIDNSDYATSNTENMYVLSNWVGIGTKLGQSYTNERLTLNGGISQIGTGLSVFVGSGAGESDDLSDNQNVAIGEDALNVNTSGSNNVAVGYKSLSSNRTGGNSTAVGYSALNSNTVGNNSAFGYNALSSNTTGSSNTALGYNVLAVNIRGGNNTGIGSNALNGNTSGGTNTAIGSRSMFGNTSGGDNVAVGYSTLFASISGIRNVSIGSRSMLSTTAGDNNTALGADALRNLTSGSNNIAIGSGANVSSSTGDNQVKIGNGNIILAEIEVAWSITSDIRLKKDIREIPFGLDMVMALRPVDYIRKKNKLNTREIGFIAQDIDSIIKKFEYVDQGFLTTDDKGYFTVRYNDFIPLLTKAIQEQQSNIESLTETNNTYESNIELLIKTTEAQQKEIELLRKEVNDLLKK